MAYRTQHIITSIQRGAEQIQKGNYTAKIPMLRNFTVDRKLFAQLLQITHSARMTQK